MSNKIVQLKDKTFTDNIYPIAGGMAADSITTQMLKDNSVTSDKIDWTTIASSSITVTKNSTYVGNVEMSSVRRTGNLIEFAFVFTLAADVTASGQTLFSGLPAPKVGVHQFTGISLLNDQLPIRVAINSAGDFKAWYNTASYLANGRAIVVSGAYFTD